MFARAGESDKIYKKDQNSIELNGLCELMIKENQFMNFNDRVDYLQELSDKLFGLEYYLNDFNSTGIMYYDLLDMYNIEIFGKTYNCLMLNDEQDITQGLEENIHTNRPETSETDYKKADTTDRKINQTYLIVDKQNQKIEGVINQIGDRTDKTTTITADIDGLASKVSTLADLTNDITGIQSVALANCVEGEVVELHIYGNNTVFKYQYLSDDLYLSDNLLLGKDKSIIIITDENGNKTYFNLGIEEVLRQRGDTRDEYILKDGQAQIIRRINKDGTIKDNETTEDLGEFHILLPKGNNTLEIKDFSASIYVKWAVQNEYTDIFATKVELNTSITQTSTLIMTEVNKKVDETEFGTKIEQNAEAVKVAWNQIAEYIQMMIINGNASLAILDDNKKVLMSLDKIGQHFYDSETVFANMGVQKFDGNKFIAFAVPGDYNQSIKDGMAWGMTTQSDGKFWPILFIKDFKMASKNAGDFSGQLVLTACDLVLSGDTSGIISGNVKIVGGLSGEINFINTEDESILLQIIPKNEYDSNSPKINLLNSIHFFENALGSHSFRIGEEQKYVLQTDEGDFHVAGGTILLGTNSSKATISMYPSSMVQIHSADLDVDGNVYANNISSDERLKNNIEDSRTNATENLNKFRIKSFNWKKDNSHIKTGFIAQQLEEIDEDYVLKKPEYNENKEIKDYRYYINELPILATLVKGFQEQQQMIENLNNTIEEMKKEINKMKGEKNG